MGHKKSRLKKESIGGVVVLLVLSIACLVPMLMVLSASLTDEAYIAKHGYSILPHEVTLDTYQFLLLNRGKMFFKALFTSIEVAILGTVYCVTVTTLFAYAVTQKKSDFRIVKGLSFFAWFATVFSGGVLPWYILCTQYYGLKNNLFALFVPYGLTVWYMYILRGSFRQIPQEMFESAKLDGATDARIFVSISIPMARTGIITVVLLNVLQFWNDFHLPMWLITDSGYQTLQKMLYVMLSNATALLRDSTLASSLEHMKLPTVTAKMAVAMMAILPLVLLYPFSLKYFVKGINMGGVKG